MKNIRMGMGSAAPNLVNICIDRNEETGSAGRVYHNYTKEPKEFRNVVQLLSYLEKFYDEISFPQASVRMRKFAEKQPEKERQPAERKTVQDFVLEQRGKKLHFWCMFSTDRMPPGREVSCGWKQKKVWNSEARWS